MMNKLTPTRAGEIALSALIYLAGDDERMGGFLSQTGLDPGAIREMASEPQFLTAVLDHVGMDESLLLAFAAHAELRPETIMAARLTLSGPPVWDSM
jgi:Protein of unknown function (DUF3572)